MNKEWTLQYLYECYCHYDSELREERLALTTQADTRDRIRAEVPNSYSQFVAAYEAMAPEVRSDLTRRITAGWGFSKMLGNQLTDEIEKSWVR